MATGFNQLYLQELSTQLFQEQIDMFSAFGISLRNPGTNQVYVILENSHQAETTTDNLITHVNNRDTVSFQWWLDNETDIHCRIRFLPQSVVQEFYLDGLGDKFPLAQTALIAYTKHTVSLGNILIGAVFDALGMSEDYNWDDFFLGKRLFDGFLPDLIVCLAIDSHRIVFSQDTLFVEQVNNYVAYYGKYPVE